MGGISYVDPGVSLFVLFLIWSVLLIPPFFEFGIIKLIRLNKIGIVMTK